MVAGTPTQPNLYTLLARAGYVMGDNIHRAGSGWPMVWNALHAKAVPYFEGNAFGKCAKYMIDDYVDATFTWDGIRFKIGNHHTRPWVGIFHHPVEIDSPLRVDGCSSIDTVLRDGRFSTSRRMLRGAITFCPVLAKHLQEKLQVPTIAMRHPSLIVSAEQQYSLPYDSEHRYVFQAGFFLRDTRMIYCLDLPQYYCRSVVRPNLEWQINRDFELSKMHHAREQCVNALVSSEARMSDEVYDEMLQQSVVVMHTHGAAANNVLVECIARNTPICLNRTKSAEHYLGQCYPLFYDSKLSSDFEDVGDIVSDEKLVAKAHAHIKALPKDWLNVDYFVDKVTKFLAHECR